MSAYQTGNTRAAIELTQRTSGCNSRLETYRENKSYKVKSARRQSRLTENPVSPYFEVENLSLEEPFPLLSVLEINAIALR
jgi:hypothetical protein